VTLVRVGFVSLPPGEKPGFDHADVYRARRRMYVAHTCANRVDVLDCEIHDPDPTGWDPVGRCLYVFCPGSGGATVYEERA
jgi:hypothetical protein